MGEGCGVVSEKTAVLAFDFGASGGRAIKAIYDGTALSMRKFTALKMFLKKQRGIRAGIFPR